MKYLFAVCTAVLIFAVVASAETQDREKGASVAALKAVIHVNFGEPKRQEQALANIENILKEVPKAEFEVVCHGDGLSLLEKNQAKHSDKVQALMKQGVRFVACENTMKKKSLDNDDLMAGTSTVPSGAVEVIRKQNEGYGYFKP